MRAFQMDGKPDIIEFTNYDRVPEPEIFNQVKERLEEIPGLKIGEKKIGPCEDYYPCSLFNTPFTLFYDMDYGTSIYAEDSGLIKKLIGFFN